MAMFPHTPVRNRAPLMAAFCALALAACGSADESAASPEATESAEAHDAATPDYAAIVASEARSADNREADGARKPAEMLEFAGVAPGMAVFEMLPGGGYFSEMFNEAVGEDGHLVLYSPTEFDEKRWKPLDRAYELAERLGLSRAAVANYPLAGPVPEDMAESFDLVWTSRNYHDFHNAEGYDGKAYNAMVLDLLKPGGTYVVLDHSAPEGSGAAATDTTHRIDAELVRKEVESAGFLYDGSSAVLANPDDTRDTSVYDGPVKGKTDQFVLRFKKPG